MYKLTLIALLSAPMATAQADTYYVDPTGGDDAKVGTSPDAPWRSLEKINATRFQPGDRILLKAGGTWNGRLHPQGSGTAKDPIVIDRYGKGERPAIHSGGLAGGAVRLDDQQHWAVRNLEVTNRGSEERRKMGIQVRNNSVGTLYGIEVTGCYPTM